MFFDFCMCGDMDFASVRFEENVVADEEGQRRSCARNAAVAGGGLMTAGNAQIHHVMVLAGRSLGEDWSLSNHVFCLHILLHIMHHNHLQLLRNRLLPHMLESPAQDSGTIVGGDDDGEERRQIDNGKLKIENSRTSTFTLLSLSIVNCQLSIFNSSPCGPSSSIWLPITE